MNSNNASSGFMLQTMLYLVNHNTSTLMNTIFNEQFEPITQQNETRCFGVYGCFETDGPWMVENRHQAPPFSPSIIDVKYPAFTNEKRNTPTFIDINDPETIRKVKIKTNGHIYFIAHGFLESGDRPWVKKLVNALLDLESAATVVVVDWKGGSSPPYYQAVANIRLIGAITAHVVYSIYEEVGLENLEKVHLIGHSLGAHLSGYAGYHLQRDFGLKVERITALDPAEPFFANTETIVRLDQTDANYVDVIHSDIAYFVNGGFGLKQKIGHVDFYPNGGREQPGCDEKVSRKLKVGSPECETPQCSLVSHSSSLPHGRHAFFDCPLLNIQRTKCPFMSITCDSYESFKKGKCARCDRDGNSCIRFGFHSRPDYIALVEQGLDETTPIATYLLTADKHPFCSAHYKMSVKVSDSEESRRHGGEIGVLYVQLKSRNEESRKIQFNSIPIYFSPGSNHTFLTIGDDVRDLKTIIVEYRFKQTFNPLTWRIFTPRIYIDFIEIESMEHNTYTKLCPLQPLAVSEDKGLEFSIDSCYKNRRK